MGFFKDIGNFYLLIAKVIVSIAKVIAGINTSNYLSSSGRNDFRIHTKDLLCMNCMITNSPGNE